MNRITTNSTDKPVDSFEFDTPEQLLALPLVRSYTDRPGIDLAYSGKSLWAYSAKMGSCIGLLDEPVQLPASVASTYER
jgi:hypothetical protein